MWLQQIQPLPWILSMPLSMLAFELLKEKDGTARHFPLYSLELPNGGIWNSTAHQSS